MLKGITVKLYERVKTGEDAFHRPIYEEMPTTVENVIVSPASAEAVINELNLSGKRLVYELSIPKQDNHKWTDSKVEFMGQTFHTFGPVEEWIEGMVPLAWNKKIKVERYE